jgi:hypothetical protein
MADFVGQHMAAEHSRSVSTLGSGSFDSVSEHPDIQSCRGERLSDTKHVIPDSLGGLRKQFERDVLASTARRLGLSALPWCLRVLQLSCFRASEVAFRPRHLDACRTQDPSRFGEHPLPNIPGQPGTVKNRDLQLHLIRQADQ